jgi:threonyl-tRNA synthetase
MNSNLHNRDDISSGIKSRSIIIMPDGQEIELNLADENQVKEILNQVGDDELSAYVQAEELKGQNRGEPPSIKAMVQQGFVDYEPSSDSGHFRLYPKGHLIFELLKDWAQEIALNRLQAMQIDSPLIYNWKDPEIREQAGSFHENHYQVRIPNEPDKEFILRFAGDFGLFKIMKSAQFSYKSLPLRVYEFSKSFRYERSGSLSGLKRLRAFHMPDIHCFCADVNQGWNEYQELYRKYSDLAESIGVKYAICFRIVDSFYDDYKEKIVELLNYSKKPGFIEILSKMKHYWAVKHEFQAIDSVGGNVQLSTVQLDVKDADVYGIRYANRDGQRKGCIICHSSIGSIERWMYAILEDAFKKEKPELPLWLSPTQLRLLPISDKFVDYCSNLHFDKIRVDIDDSDEPIGKKIARANKEWIPYVAVIGKDELINDTLNVNERSSGTREQLSKEQLETKIRLLCEQLPFRQLSLPKLLSRRITF